MESLPEHRAAMHSHLVAKHFVAQQFGARPVKSMVLHALLESTAGAVTAHLAPMSLLARTLLELALALTRTEVGPWLLGPLHSGAKFRAAWLGFFGWCGVLLHWPLSHESLPHFASHLWRRLLRLDRLVRRGLHGLLHRQRLRRKA